jgi:calcium/calmodulin-dependent 3',5'-cyclic nucleotide phosphodiesterase
LTIVRRTSGRSRIVGDGSFEVSPPSPNPDTPYLSSQSVDLEEILDNVDLTTDSLPAVDTPDACDKAALRYHIYRELAMTFLADFNFG